MQELLHRIYPERHFKQLVVVPVQVEQGLEHAVQSPLVIIYVPSAGHEATQAFPSRYKGDTQDKQLEIVPEHVAQELEQISQLSVDVFGKYPVGQATKHVESGEYK